MGREASSSFEHLTIDLVLHLVEEALGEHCTNLCRQLNSYINRVYETQTEDGDWVIAKFYRPGRWSRAALLEEQSYLFDLHEAEVPVITAIGAGAEEALKEHEGMAYALFPKKGGRICDEPTDDQWKELGHLVGRMHVVGKSKEAEHRIIMRPQDISQEHVDHILASGCISDDWTAPYEKAARRVLDAVAPCFEDTPLLRIHGDLHHQNIIHRPGESFFLIDFDDMATGPAVQDIWMLLPGHVSDSRHELNLFLEGYELFCDFNDKELTLVEPLRAMRYIHYTSWCVHQAEDGGIDRLNPGWGSPAYWRQETGALEKQLEEILATLD